MALTHWLSLGLAGGLHGHRLARLFTRFKDAGEIAAAGTAALRSAGLPAVVATRISQPDPALVERSLAWLDAPGHALLTWCDPRYPALLREIRDPPVILFVRGDPGELMQPQFAIVGSRNATPAGIEHATRFAAALSQAGLSITSGLARGVDAAAHRGAMDAGGHTIAVCGTGLDRVYPTAHRRLADRIAAHGALLAEYPPGTPVRAYQFPRRNRLISGLSLGTLVVEAGTRSGALITARLAAEQGREVFAMPGSIASPVSRGCHRLIRDGAKLVETLGDIGEELGPLFTSLRNAIEQNATHPGPPAPAWRDEPRFERLLRCLAWDPASTDELVVRSGLTAAEVSSMLLILELAGRVRPLPGGRYQQREEGVDHERNGA